MRGCVRETREELTAARDPLDADAKPPLRLLSVSGRGFTFGSGSRETTTSPRAISSARRPAMRSTASAGASSGASRCGGPLRATFRGMRAHRISGGAQVWVPRPTLCDPQRGHAWARRSPSAGASSAGIGALMHHDSVLVPDVTAVSAAAIDPGGGGCDHRSVRTVTLRAQLGDLRKDITGAQRLIHLAPLGFCCEGANIPPTTNPSMPNRFFFAGSDKWDGAARARHPRSRAVLMRPTRVRGALHRSNLRGRHRPAPVSSGG